MAVSNRVFKVVILMVAMMLLPNFANAATITSVSRATFQAAVSGGDVSGEDFDSLVDGAILGATTDLTYGASAGSPIVTGSFLTSTPPNGLGSTSFGFFNSTETASFVFNSAISAFAIDINTFAITDGSYTASLNIGDLVSSISEIFPGEETGQFIGFVSDTAFTSVTIAATTGFTYTLDTLVYGDAADVPPSVVPLPAAAWLFISALAGLVVAKHKQLKA